MNKKLLLLVLPVFVLIACDINDLNHLLLPDPPAVEQPEVVFNEHPEQYYIELFESLDFTTEISADLITDSFILNLIHYYDQLILKLNFLILIDNGNELMIARADSVIFTLSYREQQSNASSQTHWAWWSIALGKTDLRTNTIAWQGFVHSPEFGGYVIRNLSANPIN